MASLMIHLIIAEKYCKLHSVENENEFIMGNLAPDMVEDKEQAHYVEDIDHKSYMDAVLNRVNLEKFCHYNILSSDYTKGFFLHLITDYIFYNQYMSKISILKEMDKNYEYAFVREYVYDEFDKLTGVLQKKYPDINTDILPPRSKIAINKPLELFNENTVDNIIDFCANLNLTETFESVKNGNLKPLSYSAKN